MVAVAAARGPTQFAAYLATLRRRKWTIVLVTVVCLAVAIGFSEAETPVYQSSAKILLQGSSTLSAAAPVVVNIADEIQRLESPSVADIVSRQLGGPATVSGSSLAGTDIMIVTAANGNRFDAARVANAYANAYIQQRQATIASSYLDEAKVTENQINGVQARIAALNAPHRSSNVGSNPQIAPLSAQIGLLQQELNSLQSSASAATSGVQLLEPAVVATSPSSPKKVRDGLLGLGGGLVLGVALAFLRESLDDTITSKDDLGREQPALPVLGLIPTFSTRTKSARELVSATRPHSPASEAYRSLRTSVQFLALDQPVKVLQVTSPRTDEGKTTTVANLALALALVGQRVIAVDCDLRRSRLHELFGLPNRMGFTSVLSGACSLTAALQDVPDHEGLRLLSAGEQPPNPSELLSGPGARETFSALEQLADVILVDSPPVLPVTDAALLSAHADGTLLVVSAGLTTAKDLARALEVLGQVDAGVAGAVLNAVSAGTGYQYRYSYGYSPRVRIGAHGKPHEA